MDARRLLPLLATLLALGTPALAGDREHPEVTDPSGDAGAANGFGDIVSAWLTEEGGDVVATMQVAELPEAPLGDTYMVLADIEGTTFAWGVYRVTLPETFYWYGTWQRGAGPIELREGAGSEATGTPGTLTFSIPLTYLGAGNGTVLTRLTAITEVCLCGGVGPIQLPQQEGLTEQVFDAAEGADYAVQGNATFLDPAAEADRPAPSGPAGQPAPGAPRATPAADALVLALAPALAGLAARWRGGLRPR